MSEKKSKSMSSLINAVMNAGKKDNGNSFSFEDKKLKLASEIFSSLIKILNLSNFSKNEVSELFKYASDSINFQKGFNSFQDDIYKKMLEFEEGKEFSEDDNEEDLELNENEEYEDKIFKINERFNKTETSNKISRIIRKIDSIGNVDYEILIKKTVTYYFDLAPLVFKAKKEIETLCKEENIIFVEDKKTWEQCATDEDFDAEHKIYFFNEEIYSPILSSSSMYDACEYLSNNEDKDSLEKLKVIYNNNQSVKSNEILCIIESAITDINKIKDFKVWILEFLQNSGCGYAKSKLLDLIVDKFNLEGTNTADKWLAILEKSKKIKIYKNNTRWWVDLISREIS